MATRKQAVESPPTDDSQQTIEQLQQRYTSLHTKKIQSETKLGEARRQLENLKSEARTKYGTDDLNELRAKLERMKADNEKKRADYQAELQRIEGELAQVEQNFQATEAAGAKGLT
jgi:hypothetical protein